MCCDNCAANQCMVVQAVQTFNGVKADIPSGIPCSNPIEIEIFIELGDIETSSNGNMMNIPVIVIRLIETPLQRDNSLSRDAFSADLSALRVGMGALCSCLSNAVAVPDLRTRQV